MKRKMLPDNFSELIASGDMAVLMEVYRTCRIDAYRGRTIKETALALPGCPDELARWLVGQGLDVDIHDAQGSTPLTLRARRGESIDVLIELGADVNAPGGRYTESPLHEAIFRPKVVQTLIAHGADIHATDYRGRTPLARGLNDCQNAYISAFALSARLLISAGAVPPADSAKLVERIGASFEFYRDPRNPGHMDRGAVGLAELYTMFGVTPVARREMHDGTSPIVVTATRWADQFGELNDLLVPGAGAATTQQGEVIRLAGNISHEICVNGSINWRNEHRRSVDALIMALATGTPTASAEDLAALRAIVRPGRPDKITMDATDRLKELAVGWVLVNPHPTANPALGNGAQ